MSVTQSPRSNIKINTHKHKHDDNNIIITGEEEKNGTSTHNHDHGNNIIGTPETSKRLKSADDQQQQKTSSSPSSHIIDSNGHSPPLEFPSDWPSLSGTIDLSRHDFPHLSSRTEWWYINGHLKSQSSQRQLSFFVAFFRIATDQNVDGSYQYAHSLTWALIDPAKEAYYTDAILDQSAPAALIPIVQNNIWEMDPRLNKAILEILRKNTLPLPDRLFTESCHINTEDTMLLSYGDNYLTKDASTGRYHLHCINSNKGMLLDLFLTPSKLPQRQAHDGVVKVGVKDEWMFYYFIPRLETTGEINIKGQIDRVSGNSWYDHEFGGDLQPSSSDQQISKMETPLSNDIQERKEHVDTHMSTNTSNTTNGVTSNHHDNHSNSNNNNNNTPIPANKFAVSSMQTYKSKPNHAWNWISLQFNNNYELTATHLLNTATQEVIDNYAIIIHPDSSQSIHYDMILKMLNVWISLKTTNDYPTSWTLSIPSQHTELKIDTAFVHQEFIHIITRPAFYEGRVIVSGMLCGQSVYGEGFIERYGFTQMKILDYFFKRMSKEVMKSLNHYLPHHPSYHQTKDLLCRVDTDTPFREYSHLMAGVSEEIFHRTIVEPIRLIADRGGKSWRSYAMLLCIDVVGGDSQRFKAWLPMPEVMHVGSLIIDDIQDASLTRRGGPACHIVYGVPIAINAGNYAYFLSPRALTEKIDPPLTAEQKARCYDIFFHTMRAGHVGQAFDIYGMGYMMEQIIQYGDVDNRLESIVACTHKLKSAVPAGCLARMGAYVGGATEKQMEVLGLYFEAVGVAFQIVDDVLNLKGFVGETKVRGEDITAGKVTFPVAMAMKPDHSTTAQRQRMWSLINLKTSDMTIVDEVIGIIESCNGVKLSYEFSDRIVKAAWAEMDPHIPDSFYKVMLRAFGFYVLERHY